MCVKIYNNRINATLQKPQLLGDSARLHSAVITPFKVIQDH